MKSLVFNTTESLKAKHDTQLRTATCVQEAGHGRLQKTEVFAAWLDLWLAAVFSWNSAWLATLCCPVWNMLATGRYL